VGVVAYFRPVFPKIGRAPESILKKILSDIKNFPMAKKERNTDKG